MGVRRDREKVYRYKNIYNSLNFFYGKNVFRISGKIAKWEEIEIISRIFYEKLEQLLYTKEFINRVYEEAMTRVLKINNLYDKSLFQVLKDKKFHLQDMNIFIMRLFDYVYHNIKKHLPYVRKLSTISGSISELLENTFKYSNGEFCLTAGIKESEYPLIIKIENKYNMKDENVMKNLEKLKEIIEEMEMNDDPNAAVLEVMKKRLTEYETDKNASRLGFAKIKMATQALFKLSLSSNTFKEEGISITLFIPLEMYTAEDLEKKLEELKNGIEPEQTFN